MTDTVKKTTKVDTATIIVTEALANGTKPKDVIAELMIALNMEKTGASTYYYNVKRKIDLAVSEVAKDAKNAARRAKNAANKAAKVEAVEQVAA